LLLQFHGIINLQFHLGENPLQEILKGTVVGVDIDAVCADHNAEFRKFVAKALDMPAEQIGDQLDWEYKSWGITDEQFILIHQDGVRESMFLNMPPIEGVQQSLKALSDMGATIRIITHRLYAKGNHEVAVTDTAAWLDDHKIPYHDLCMIGDKPAVYADVYIDDAPHNVHALRDKTGKPVLVFDQPYNQHLDGPRVKNWGEVVDAVLDTTGARNRSLQGVLFDVDDLIEDPLEKIDPRNRKSSRKDPADKASSRRCGATNVTDNLPCQRPVGAGNKCPMHS
jgi:5'-nucleotidase